jgi:hypothetical protein
VESKTSERGILPRAGKTVVEKGKFKLKNVDKGVDLGSSS